MRTPYSAFSPARAQWLRWPCALVGVGLLLAGWTAPAVADQSASPTLTLSHLWNQVGNAGSWTPYAITVRNDGQGTFTGTAILVPNPPGRNPGPPESFPQYEAAVSVPAGGQRTLTAYVIEPSTGYHAELRDTEGRLRTTADPSTAAGSGAAVAVLSDLPQAQQRIDALLRSQSQLDAGVSRFSSGRAFPSDVIRLSGLNGLILDQFDSGTLDQDQQRALKDFVALGGTLVETGGAGGRRTLGPLPAELLPMRPAATATASLSPLAELGGVATSATAQVITGDVATWARVAVAAPDGTPLVVEGAYGAGQIVELAFDPLVAPFDAQVDLAATAWSQALSRGLGGALGGGSSQLTRLAFGGVPRQAAAPRGSGPGAATGFPGYLYQVLTDAPATASPPFGLLAGLLIVYVLVVSVLAYAVLRAVGRRGLLWIAVPAAAIACTAVAYAVGFGTRGSDYELAQVQVQRLGPGGVMETSAFDGVLSPRRGDVSVTAPANALVSTGITLFGPPPSAGGQDPQITVAATPRVTFPNVAVWDMRPVQTLTVTHPAGGDLGTVMPIEAHLGVRAGHLVGQVFNHTSQGVRNLQLISPSGSQAHLTSVLAPGATATIDVPLSQGAPGLPIGKGVVGVPIALGPGPGPVPPQNGGQAMVALAVSEVAVQPGEWALVGQVDPSETLRVGGQRPARSGRAMVVEPTRLESADTLAASGYRTRLVSSYSPNGGGVIDLYELELPPGLTGGVALTATLAFGPQVAAAPSLEVYDWDQHTWRLLSRQRTTAAAPSPVPLTPGEVHGGVVRARVAEDLAGSTALTVSDAR